MSDMKTTETDSDPISFLARHENRGRAEDARTVMEMMQRITGQPPRMWGDSIIGFGSYGYARRDGTRHRYFRTGVSPRKTALTVYVMPGFSEYADLLGRLGKHKHSASCLYLGRLSDVDGAVLEELIARGWRDMARLYPE